jgi:predicted permease
MSGFAQDLRYSIRGLARTPGFTFVAILSLALGIGANTAIFSLMNAIMLKTLPVEQPERLVLLESIPVRNTPREVRRTQSGYGDLSLPFVAFEHIREESRTLSSVFGFVPLGFDNQSVAVTWNGESSLAAGEMVSGEYFTGLGVRAIFGRTIVRSDEQPDAPPVVVLSHRYWSGRFGADPSAIGEILTLNRKPFTIIGVAPREFFGTNRAHAADLWVPLRDGLGLAPWGVQSPPGASMFADQTWWWVMVGGRLAPGVSEAEARAELDVLFRRSITEPLRSGASAENIPGLTLVTGGSGLQNFQQTFSEPLLVLMVVVAVVLLIACANVATLLLARASVRREEMSVRLAAGASRARLVRQLLTESGVLAVLGGGLGCLFALWGTRALLVTLSSGPRSVALDIAPDARVLFFTGAVCVVTLVIFGLAPAFRATKVDLSQGLRHGSRRGSPRLTSGKVLVIGQLALMLPLLIGAGLLLRTTNNLLNVGVGFDQRNLLLFGLDPRRGGYTQEQIAATYQQVIEQVSRLQGVRSVTASGIRLLSGTRNNTGITTDGPPQEQGLPSNAHWNWIGPDFFETMDIPIVLGRSVEWSDIQTRRRVIVINEVMARYFFPNRNPLGHRVWIKTSREPMELEIVGVSGNARYANLREEVPRTMYVPYTVGEALGRLFFSVRTTANPAAVVPALREVVRQIDPELPLIDVKTQADQVAELLNRERMFASLATFFAVLALALASVGLYGTLAYGVTRRTNEIGIRLALGADRLSVVGMILRESLSLIGIGAAIGLAIAIGATRLIASQLYGVKPTDILTFAGAVAALVVMGALAGYLPARRAARVDPLVALRYE